MGKIDCLLKLLEKKIPVVSKNWDDIVQSHDSHYPQKRRWQSFRSISYIFCKDKVKDSKINPLRYQTVNRWIDGFSWCCCIQLIFWPFGFMLTRIQKLMTGLIWLMLPWDLWMGVLCPVVFTMDSQKSFLVDSRASCHSMF